MKQAIDDRGAVRGWHVLAGMVLFFLAVMAVNGIMMYKAISTFGGDTPDAYRTGLNYNQRIAEERRQEQLGWTETSKFESGSSRFSFTLKDRAGHGIEGLRITGTIGRPATDIADRAVSLSETGEGTYSVALPDLSEGTWEASLEVTKGNDRQHDVIYQSRVRLWKQP